MALTKRAEAIYNRYGIETRNGKLVTPFGMEVCPLLPVGTNSKVGDAATWSIYHGNEKLRVELFGEHTREVMTAAGVDEIAGSCPCHCRGCYCDSGCYNYDSTKAANMLKLILARKYPDWTRAAIMAQIEADGISQCRIHAAGDFFSREYAEMWRAIAEAFPGVIFWTYTKNADALEVFQDVKSVHIVPSITPEGINFGTCAELLQMYHKLTAAGYRVHICACGTAMEKHCSDCIHGCKAIGSECDYVLFIKHSTRDYKAGKKDAAEYAAVCEIIANQEN